MTQNNDNNNGAEGDEQRPCQTPAGEFDIPRLYRGRYTIVRRSEAVSRTDDTMGLAGNTDHCQRMYTNRRLPLNFSLDDEDEEDEEETPPAKNGQENRESALVQTAEQETQENRESASEERSGRSGQETQENRLSASAEGSGRTDQETQENRLSASAERSGRSDQENGVLAPNQQDALMGGQPWSEQMPSQDHFRRPPFLGSYNDCKDYLDKEMKRLEALQEACERLKEIEDARRAQLQQCNELAQSNHRG